MQKERQLEILKKLKEEYNFEVTNEDYQNQLLNWIEYMGDSLETVANYGKCKGCEMPEYIIHQEIQAGDMKSHIICEGCGKDCDGGDKDQNNNHTFEDKRYGAWVFYTKQPLLTRVEEWYCKKCKFDLLCGDCGSPHELDTDMFYKEEYENFAKCESCQIDREGEYHKEEHTDKVKPELDCSYCADFVEEGNTLTEKKEIKSDEQIIEICKGCGTKYFSEKQIIEGLAECEECHFKYCKDCTYEARSKDFTTVITCKDCGNK